MSLAFNDGKLCAMKVACTVWMQGKVGDSIKDLPMHNDIDGKEYCRVTAKLNEAVMLLLRN